MTSAPPGSSVGSSPADHPGLAAGAGTVAGSGAATFALEHRSIDARSVVTLIVFFAVNILVIFPLRIPLPRVIGDAGRNLRDAALGLGRYDTAGDGHHTHRGHGHVGDGIEKVAEHEADTAHGLNAAPVGPCDHVAHCGTGRTDLEVTDPAEDDMAPDPDAKDVTRMAGHERHHAVDAPSTAPTPGLTEAPASPPAAFELGLATAPVAGVLLLLASTCISGSVVRGGIVGGVRPYDIMTLFLSFAYISLSLDCTGLLRYLAFTVAERSSSSGKTLFFALYALFVLLSLGVGNDPVVLSGTPFVAYFTSHARISPPTPFLFAQFQAANLASALLVSSNPTNLVLTSSFHLSFLSFSAWTALPTVAAAVLLYPVIAVLYRHLIPKTLDPPRVNPRDALVDPFGAMFTSTVFIGAIIALVALSAVGKLEGVEGVWTVTAPAALLVLFRDSVHDLRKGSHGGSAIASKAEEMETVGPGRTSDDEAAPPSTTDDVDVPKAGIELRDLSNGQPARRRLSARADLSAPSSHPSSSTIDPSSTLHKSSRASSPTRVATSTRSPTSTTTPSRAPSRPRHPVARLRHTFPTVSAVVARLPLPLLPFAFSMFILVDALEYTGWVGVWAKWWAAWARAGGTAGCIWLMGVISVLGCNILGTNIGVTVLLSRILVVWRDATQPSNRTLFGSILALALGSNFGAYSFVFAASLAGLLWRDILAQKGLAVGQLEFMRWNMVPLWTTMVVGCCVVGAEVCVMFK